MYYFNVYLSKKNYLAVSNGCYLSLHKHEGTYLRNWRLCVYNSILKGKKNVSECEYNKSLYLINKYGIKKKSWLVVFGRKHIRCLIKYVRDGIILKGNKKNYIQHDFFSKVRDVNLLNHEKLPFYLSLREKFPHFTRIVIFLNLNYCLINIKFK